MLIIWILMFALSFWVLDAWGLRNNWGSAAFDNAPVRANSIEIWVPIFLFGMWLLASVVFAWIIAKISGAANDAPIIMYSSSAASGVITSYIALIFASISFNEGIKGFGLNFATFKADFVKAFSVLLRICPIIYLVMTIVEYAVKRLSDGRLQMPEHPLLEFAGATDNIVVMLLIFLMVSFIAPILEELIFRGFLQTKIADNLESRWLGVFIASAMFAAVHGGSLWLHWPALFVFSCTLGYSYEKSGSLLQPIIMHSLFNTGNFALSLMSGYWQG